MYEHILFNIVRLRKCKYIVLTLTLKKHSKDRHSALKTILLFILCAEWALILMRTSQADDK